MLLFQGSESESFTLNVGAGSITESSDAAAIEAAYSRRGTQVGGSSSTYIIANAESALDDGWFHCVNRYSGTTGGPTGSLIELMDSSDNTLVRLGFTSANNMALQYWNGSAYVTVGLTTVHNGAARRRFDIRFRKHASTGLVEWYIDNTLFSTSGDIDLSAFGDVVKAKMWRAGGSGSTIYSQVSFSDENPISTNVWTAPAAADGTDNSDGSGTYVDINETPLSDANYIELSANGEHRSFVSGARTTTDTIRGVTVTARALTVDGTGPQNFKLYLLIGGVRYYSTTFALTNGMVPYTYTWILNPATGLAWTNSEANDSTLEWGFEAVT
jgi:hypothetical protein